VWCYRFIWPKPGTLGACSGKKQPENGPKTARTATEFRLARHEREIMSEILNTRLSARARCARARLPTPPRLPRGGRLARNAPVAHLGAPSGCQSVVLSVHMAKTKNSGRMFGLKTARTAIEFRLARPEQESMSEILNTPTLARNAPFAYLGAPVWDAKVRRYRFIWPKPGTLGACLGGKWPENGRNVGQKTKFDPNRNVCLKF
jgi:hypothetical protein